MMSPQRQDHALEGFNHPFKKILPNRAGRYIVLKIHTASTSLLSVVNILSRYILGSTVIYTYVVAVVGVCAMLPI